MTARCALAAVLYLALAAAFGPARAEDAVPHRIPPGAAPERTPQEVSRDAVGRVQGTLGSSLQIEEVLSVEFVPGKPGWERDLSMRGPAWWVYGKGRFFYNRYNEHILATHGCIMFWDTVRGNGLSARWFQDEIPGTLFPCTE